MCIYNRKCNKYIYTTLYIININCLFYSEFLRYSVSIINISEELYETCRLIVFTAEL